MSQRDSIQHCKDTRANLEAMISSSLLLDDEFVIISDEENVKGQVISGVIVTDFDDSGAGANKGWTADKIASYVSDTVASSVNYRGGYNAATNTPDLDTAPSGVSIGDIYTVTAAGTFFTAGLEVGDMLIAEQDDPVAETDWTIVNKNLDDASIKVAYENNADTNAFTDADESKLDGIEAAATADQTGAEIKTLYEAEADTNAYDDAAVSKLAGIETAATADQTDAEIKTAYENNADTNAFTDADESKLDGIEALADVTDTTNVDAAGAVMNTDATTASMSFVIDEDTLVSDSATKVPTQQSVKAYVDTEVGAIGTPSVQTISSIRTPPSYQLDAGSGFISSEDVTATSDPSVKFDLLGTAREAAADDITVTHDENGVPSLPVYGAYTNEIRDPDDFSTGNWSTSGIPTLTTTITSIAGGSKYAQTVEDDAAGSNPEGYEQDVTCPDDSNPAVMFIAVMQEDDETIFPAIGFSFTGGSPTVTGVISINKKTGETATNVGSVTDIFVRGIRNEDGDKFWGVWVTQTNNSSGNTIARLAIDPAFNSVLGDPKDGSVVGTSTFDLPQIFLGTSVLYPPLVNTAAGVATVRAKDTAVGAWNEPNEYTALIDLEPLSSGSTRGYLDINEASNDGRVTIFEISSNFSVMVDGNTTVLSTSAAAVGVRHRICMAYGRDGFYVAVNGVEKDTGASTSGVVATEMLIGKIYNSSGASDSEVYELKVYPTKLTDEQCLALSTIPAES